MTRFMVFVLALCGLAALSFAQDSRTPVLLELFTAEGCSSCPPADQLLAKIDREQPVEGVDLIVIGEHVDYWNHGGWVDRYSSPAFTQRQERYAKSLHVDDVYTPELVVDGAREVVGSDWPKAKIAIEAERHARTLSISLQTADNGDKRMLTAKVGPDPTLPAGDVYLALAADAMETQVNAGENAGRHLSHIAVAYQISKIGKISAGSEFEKSVALPAHAKWGASSSRVIVFVQDPGTGRILGVARAKQG